MVWCGMVWYGMVWYGTVRYGMVRYGMVTWTVGVSVSVRSTLLVLRRTHVTCIVFVFAQLGDVFADRYVVVKKLGWGHFSTVWMARDDRRTSSTAPKVTHHPIPFAFPWGTI